MKILNQRELICVTGGTNRATDGYNKSNKTDIECECWCAWGGCGGYNYCEKNGCRQDVGKASSITECIAVCKANKANMCWCR